MATVASLYDVEPNPRTAEAIMGLCSDETKPARPRASAEREPEEVIQEMFEEALRRDSEKKRPRAILVDGGEKQLDLVLGGIHEHRPEASLILDFIHVLEYIWKAARALSAVGSADAEKWVSERALRLPRGDAARIAHEPRKNATLHHPSSEKRKPVDKCSDYLEKYGPMPQYNEYLSEGLPIASGVIEGACRHLIKDRMDRTGARWRIQRGEAVLKIRSMRSSGDIDAYWKFRQTREYQRNHGTGNPLACAT